MPGSGGGDLGANGNVAKGTAWKKQPLQPPPDVKFGSRKFSGGEMSLVGGSIAGCLRTRAPSFAPQWGKVERRGPRRHRQELAGPGEKVLEEDVPSD